MREWDRDILDEVAAAGSEGVLGRYRMAAWVESEGNSSVGSGVPRRSGDALVNAFCSLDDALYVLDVSRW